MGDAQERRGQEILLRRLREMGVEARLLADGRTLLGELVLPGPPLRRPGGPPITRVRFASVGTTHLKCLEPLALFQLPLVPLAGAASAAALAERIGEAWRRRRESLEDAARRLDALGIAWRAEAGGALLRVPVETGEDAALHLTSLERIALPTPGPLAGLPLPRAGERLAAAPRDLESGMDLELAVTARCEELARRERRRAAARRLQAPEPPAPGLVSGRGGAAGARLLLVGPALAQDARLAQALTVRGYRVTRAVRPREALRAFARASFDLVLADARLGREEGAELVPAIQRVPGVRAVPVVLVDDRPRPARREAARQAGAAGYLARPLHLERIAPGLARMASGRRGRRFERVPLRLGVGFGAGDDAGGVSLEVSRGGLFVRTERTLRRGERVRLELALPGRARPLPVEAQAVYRLEASGAREPGLGLRLVRFARSEDEASWIAAVCGAADEALG